MTERKFTIGQRVACWMPGATLPLIERVGRAFWVDRGDVFNDPSDPSFLWAPEVPGWYYELETVTSHESCLRSIDDDQSEKPITE